MPPRSQYPRRRRTRLPAAAYADTSGVCSVTIATAARLPFFLETELASSCIELLRGQAGAGGIDLHAYCLMPDHVHLLVTPSSSVSIIEFVRRFKSLSTRLHWDRGHHGKLWQAGFYDHFLRGDDDLWRVTEYILDNPVRASLVPKAAAYPFSGSSRSQ